MSPPVSTPAASAPPCVSSAEPATWFKDEVQPHERQLRAYLRGSFPTVRDVDDVVQESFLRIWKARLVRRITSTKSFLFQTAYHLAIDIVRRRNVAQTDSLGDMAELAVMDDRPDAADHLAYSEKVELLASALLSLPPRCREVMILRKLKGVPVRDIAFRQGVAQETVNNQVTRGTHLLRQYLEKHGVRGFRRE